MAITINHSGRSCILQRTAMAGPPFLFVRGRSGPLTFLSVLRVQWYRGLEGQQDRPTANTAMLRPVLRPLVISPTPQGLGSQHA